MPDLDATIAALEADMAAHQRRVLILERAILILVLVAGTVAIGFASGGFDGLIRQHVELEARP